MIKQIDGKWYHSIITWEPLEEPSANEITKCLNFRLGQKHRKEGKGMLYVMGSYLDGWHDPEKVIPPYITADQKEAFDL